ncbi:hypothetical protein M422DRAFT_46343 [Sphaerobolus stellatus SS14]|uniref:Uncharacterized protein n=1 Tax=Sphaerobolus stellatus (strain SS14) TaxID=990650 RepID=A0A0C9VG97_SPHS4|nr:hypothetical protein M422DRAFT_46343 [Sphaerobolus stellatus SS14]
MIGLDQEFLKLAESVKEVWVDNNVEGELRASIKALGPTECKQQLAEMKGKREKRKREDKVDEDSEESVKEEQVQKARSRMKAALDAKVKKQKRVRVRNVAPKCHQVEKRKTLKWASTEEVFAGEPQ